MLPIRPTDEFDEDLSRVKRRAGGFDVEELLSITRLLSQDDVNEEILDAYSDHALRGRWGDCRDIHIEDDLILVYKIEDNCLKLVRLATHAELEQWNY